MLVVQICCQRLARDSGESGYLTEISRRKTLSRALLVMGSIPRNIDEMIGRKMGQVKVSWILVWILSRGSV